ARRRGVERGDVGEHLSERRHAWYAALPRPGRLESVLRRATASAVPLAQALPRAVGSVYESPSESSLDVLQVDYYVADAATHLVMPGRRTAGGRITEPVRPLWDDHPDPQGLVRYCRAAAEPGLPIQVIENGLCNRVVGDRAFARGDGWDRPRYLRENIAAVLELVDSGVPVTGYWHWTLADNYEWGSYEPRFGLFGVDRARGCRWSPLDSMGHDAAGAYRRIIAGLRSGDRHAVEPIA
ncbi:MAG TPA: family 1 glycosylhydrolase, partial [Acidimicrobiales bacterium]|nr:family 1 glycosylhydrolase [Acidimicrobiales bacterium]